jgi:ABC-type multidrug transport system fused ATPase/permease subunit
VGERGARLSGGQRQRLALARAVLRDAPLASYTYEPTSALDTESEGAGAGGPWNASWPIEPPSWVAHRLSTIRHADRVLVLEQGRIVQQGTPRGTDGQRRSLSRTLYAPIRRSRCTGDGGDANHDHDSAPTHAGASSPICLASWGARRLPYVLSLPCWPRAAPPSACSSPNIVKGFVDAIVGADLPTLEYAVRSWAIFLGAWIPLNVLSSFWWRSTTYRAVADLRQRVFAHIQRLPMRYFEGRHSGDLLSVLTNDVAAVDQAFQEHLLTLVSAVIQGASAIVFMGLLSWPLMLVIVVSGLVPLAANALFAGPLRKAADAIQAHLGAASERLSDLLAGFRWSTTIA